MAPSSQFFLNLFNSDKNVKFISKINVNSYKKIRLYFVMEILRFYLHSLSNYCIGVI